MDVFDLLDLMGKRWRQAVAFGLAALCLFAPKVASHLIGWYIAQKQADGVAMGKAYFDSLKIQATPKRYGQ